MIDAPYHLVMLTVAPGLRWLIDLRMSDGFRITTDGVRRMASRRLALSPASRRAVVVPRGLGYAMARMYQMLRGDGAPRVFTSYEEAYHWAIGPTNAYNRRSWAP